MYSSDDGPPARSPETAGGPNPPELGPPLDDVLAWLESSLALLARVAAGATLHRAVQRSAGVDLKHDAAQFLYYVVERDGIRPTEVAAIVGVSQPTASRQAAALVDAGYIRKVSDPGDSRAVLLEPTRKGRSAINALRREYRNLARRALASWERDDIVTLGALADRYANAIHHQISIATRDAG